MGRESYPDMEHIRQRAEACAGRTLFVPCNTLGMRAGAVQAGNMALLGALAATKAIPLTPDDLRATVRARLKPKIVDLNLTAIDLGVEAAA